MPLIATDTPRFSHLVKHEYEPSIGYCRSAVDSGDAVGTVYKVGTVLGKVTATGKYVVAKDSAADGSKAAAAIVLQDFTVAAGAKVLVMVRGQAIVSKGALVLDASVDTDPKKVAIYDALEAKGILVNETV